MKHPGELTKSDTQSGSEIRSLTPYRESTAPHLHNNGDPDFDDEQELGLRDYWLMVRQRLWLTLAITFLVTSLSVIYVARQPDVYEAEATIQVDLEKNFALGGGKDGSVIINTPGDETAYLNTQLLLLKSPAFLRRVVKTLNMEQGPNAFAWGSGRRETAATNILPMKGIAGTQPENASGAKPLRATSIAPLSADGDMEEAQKLEPYVGAIRRGLDVKLTETSRLISITFRDSDPNSAAKAANVVADSFVQANWERRATSTSTASEFLQKRIAELQFKIGENERRLIEYARDHQILPLDSGRDMASDRMAALDRGLLEAENTRKAAESDFQAALAPGAAAAMVEGNNSAQLNTIESKLADLRHRRAVMLIEAGENWPEVKELDKQIGDLEEQLKSTRERAIEVLLTNLDTRYRQALAREQSLRKGFERQHSSTMNQSEAAIDYRMIQQETTTYRTLLDNLLQRSKENDIVLAATPNNVRVTDYATLPMVAVGPRRLTIVATAFAVSLGLAIGFVILLGTLEDSVQVDSVERVERMFGLPALAVIPIQGQLRRQVQRILKLRSRIGHRVEKLLLRGETNAPQPESEAKPEGNGTERTALLIYNNGKSPLTESFKKLRTSILFSTGSHALRTLLVTSSLPGEGKTTAVINTGVVMSQTGAKVLLIDADLRHPTLQDIMGVGNAIYGLSTILSCDMSDDESLSMIEQYNGSNLYVLPAGPETDKPAELLGSERLRRLIKLLNSRFSHIIIDSPPISFFTDAVLMSSVVDGVLMVVRGPKSPRQVVRFSLQSLDGVGAPVLGVVLNAVNVRSHDYSYYRKYYR